MPSAHAYTNHVYSRACTVSMRVVALVSGGKDSCYNAIQCVAAGHTLVALANLQPEGRDELDSFMFQTVGHEAVDLFAEAMGLPLYRAVTSGRSKGRSLHYSPEEGDEVEDLYGLLLRVQAAEGVEGVASGAVLSDYQRLRVEHVCGRLGMTSLAYLWRRDQAQLLEEMIASGVSAILIKVAAIGLNESHLGRTLQEMQPHLLKLHSRYGVHMCGEGGEYESFTLDCPLFAHRIVVDESEVRVVTRDEVAPVAYLKLSQLHLEKKCASLQRVLPPSPDAKTASCQVVSCGGGRGTSDNVRTWRWGVFEGSSENISGQTHHVFSELADWLERHRGRWTDVALIRLCLSSMQDFSLVNSIYRTFFPSKPPARVCVQLTLPAEVLVRMEVLLCKRLGEEEGDVEGELVTMHVQSLSHWAPANIGPYSQAVRGGKVVFTAGQIGLQPANMNMVPPTNQPSVSLAHVTSVLEANHTHLGSAICGVCYYTTEEAGWAARMAWRQLLQQLGGCGPAVVFLRVPALPREACVEWSFTALTSPCQLHYQTRCDVKEGLGMLYGEEVIWCGEGSECVESGSNEEGRCPLAGAWMLTLNVRDAVRTCIQDLGQQLAAAGTSMADLSQLRFFLPHYSSDPPLSFDELNVLSDSGAVTVSTCEGYFGQNSPVSILALLLTPSLLTSH